MKKSILFIIISIFTAVTFLSTAAVCNLCSGLSTIADNIENSQLLQSQASSSNTASGKTPEEEDSSGQGDNTQQNQDQQQDEHHEAPEISIFYDEEPIYSEQDDTWRYIIVSEVYGNPFPKVTWNRDDSNGEHGEYAVQINLKRDEVFKVIATAQNYLEAKTSEITLKYGSPVQQQIEPPDDGRENQQVDQGEQINTEQGDSKEPALLIGGLQSFDHRSIALEGNNCIGGKEDRLVVGDIETVLDKTPHFRSFLRFNIMNISERYSGVTVKDSTLLVDTTVYPPVSGFGDFCIGVVDNQWYTQVGPGPVTSPSNAVLETPQEIARYSNFQGGRIDVKSSALNNILLRYADASRKYINFVFYWSNPQGYPDGEIHYAEINWANLDVWITHD